MTHKSCNLAIPETVWRTSRSLVAAPRWCKECSAPLDDPNWLGPFCHVCNTLFETVRSSRWLTAAQTDWVEENDALAQRKRDLLGTPAEEQDGAAS